MAESTASEAGFFRGEVQVGNHGDDGEDVVGGDEVGVALHRDDAFLHASRRQTRLGLVVPALLYGLTEHRQTLHTHIKGSGL